jgi:hypothetical protein
MYLVVDMRETHNNFCCPVPEILQCQKFKLLNRSSYENDSTKMYETTITIDYRLPLNTAPRRFILIVRPVGSIFE